MEEEVAFGKDLRAGFFARKIAFLQFNDVSVSLG